MDTQSNFFLQRSKAHYFDGFNLDNVANVELHHLFQTYEANMKEVLYVVQSYFNLMVHAKLQETTGKIFDRNRMLAYADGLRGGYSDDSKRIDADAAERTKKEIDEEGFEKYGILNVVTERLNKLEKDEEIEASNRATLRQSVVIIWSATESLIRDVIRVKLNNDSHLASEFFESSHTNPFWQKKQISFEHLKSNDFDLSNRLGDVALDINSCSNLGAMTSAFSFLFGKDSQTYSVLKSDSFYKLYKLRNVIAHRNGVVDEKYKNETKCSEDIGQRVSVTPSSFTSCFETSKQLALQLLNELSNDTTER